MSRYYQEGIQYTEVAGPVLKPAAPVVVPDQFPVVYPDKIDRKTLATAALPFFFAVFAIPQWDVPANAWEGVYPARIDRKVERAADQPSFYSPVGLEQWPVPSLSWRGQYPDRIPPKVSLPAGEQQFLAYTPAIEQWAIPDGSWKGQYPDRIDRQKFLADEQRAFFFDPFPIVPVVTPDFFQAIYPDRFPNAPWRDRTQLANVFAIEQWEVPPLSWEPHFPERARKNYLAPAEMPSHFLPYGLEQWPVPALSWGPSYPDRVVKKYLLTAAQQHWAMGFGLPEWPVPALSWNGSYPESARGRKPQQPDSLAWSTFTPAEVAVPELSWEAVYADFARRLRPQLLGGEAVRSLEFPPNPPVTLFKEHIRAGSGVKRPRSSSRKLGRGGSGYTGS